MSITSYRARLSAAAAAIAVSAAIAAPAFAESATPDANVVDEVIVTVQKREQFAKDVPAAVTAYSGDFLSQIGVQDFSTLSAFVPGFEVQNQSPNNPGFVMRGITSDSLDSTVEPRVSVFQDGVSIAKAAGSFVELYDISRVEIAKGPQSTLFGRGALIGAVNIVQAKANPNALDSSARAEIGDLNYVYAEGMVNVPVGDTFAVRAAAVLHRRDGVVQNVLDGNALSSYDTWATRLSFAWRPTDTLRADLIFNYQNDTPTATSFKSGRYLPTNPTTGAVLAGLKPWQGAALAVPDGFLGKQLGLDREVWGGTGIVAWDFAPNFKLTSTSAYRYFHAAEVGDADGTSLPILSFLNDARGEQWSQEFRVNYDAGGAFSWFAGVDYFKEKGSDSTPAQFDERMSLAQLTGQLNANAITGFAANRPAPASVFGVTAFTGQLVRGLVFATSNGHILLNPAVAQAIAANLKSNHLEVATNSSDLKSWDLFADGTWRATDKLEFSLGVRYTTDQKTTGFSSKVVNGRSILGGVIAASQIAASNNPVAIATGNAILNALTAPNAANIPYSGGYPIPVFGLTFQPTLGNGSTITQDLDSDGFTWRATGLYKASPELNLYATYARGRRPDVLGVGGPSSPQYAGLPTDGLPRFTLVDAETVDSYEVGAKAELFDRRLRWDTSLYSYKYNNFQTVVQQGTLFVTTNAGKATAYGLETQAFLKATPNLDLYATYAYSHGRFDGGAYDGNQFRLAPDHSLSLGATVKFQGLGGRFEFRPIYTWQSKVYFDDNNDRSQFQQPPSVFVADNIQDEVQKAYGLLNLRLLWQGDNMPWSIEAFVNNAADEKYIIDAGNTGDALGIPTFIAGAPRTVGLVVSYKH